ncbi:SusD/RagB family nutrient-binding outer membrane lipoprotein [Mucilaginibacter aquariorum]|uniref:SusD/RagB family nutrient-binding outer membrane lipoprotein n=1 Tax=Mucilaginibacter aquariorum TaxID=2967225 RepID=A0ABT1T9X2_9SPHI|nr:SusD/RagB family nutrient-binding outer membrane lipoprotein [Mucilaginibacter aquariorum]MCQ6961175.1 SusD/RagB family nutrient-binding outer membrane lipoprotein [Mucilaginibacter aquariorum]
MKKIFSIALTGICLFSATSCKKYLDVNKNPNQPLESTPELVLPQAIVATAALVVNTGDYNAYGSALNGYFGNAGGFGSLGVLISYAFTTGDYNGLFQNTFDNLGDYQYIIDKTDANSVFNAAANIMKAYDYQMLVDTYNDVPYSDALKGLTNLQPKYDKGADVYKDLGDKLDAAITFMNTIPAASVPKLFNATSDPMFGGDTKKWAQFANTIKLRLIIRAGGKVSFTKPTPDATVGFVTADVLVQPGYSKTAGKQNPYWDKWAYSEIGTTAPRTAANVYMPTPYILTYFNGTKILDDTRGQLIFQQWAGSNGTTTPVNQLGYTLADAPKAPSPAFWFTFAALGSNGEGLFKGETGPQPIMLASESYFLQAEANLRGILTGVAKTNFDNGVKSAFAFLFRASGPNKADPAVYVEPWEPYYQDYLDKEANEGNYLVHYEDATTDAQRLEAIITQKYLALIYQFGGESWNEYRRTGYPRSTGSDPETSFASSVSQSTAPDKLPTRVLYPVSEYTYNSANTPAGINPYTDKIFWAK